MIRITLFTALALLVGLGGCSKASSVTCAASGASAADSAPERAVSGDGAASTSSDGATEPGPPFAAGTVCNSTGVARSAPLTVKHLIVILFENENNDSVIGSGEAPFISSLASQCGVATAYQDDCFAGNLVSLPHYLALTSGSNCNAGLERSGAGCITSDFDATFQKLSGASIFSQVSSWRSYQEDMPITCSRRSRGRYAAKHNPAAYYSALDDCALNDVGIAALNCDPCTRGTACYPAPRNAFVTDLEQDTLAALTFVTPTLDNDMHDGTVTQADNWVYTYLPLILASRAYLRGDVVVQLLWDEQTTSTFGGPIPNVFISPYITAGTRSSTSINHFSVLRSWEQALGISTFLGCAGGVPPGGIGNCPDNSLANVRDALGW